VNRKKEIVKGEKFRKFLQKIITKKNYLKVLEKKNYPLFLIDILLNNGVKDPEFLQKRKNLEKIQNLLNEKGIISIE